MDTFAYGNITSVTGNASTSAGSGPASMGAYASGQLFRFTPVSSNASTMTLNVTPAGGAALGAKAIFSAGVAMLGSELLANVPALVQYDGTQFHLLSHQPLRVKTVLFTRDTTTATGTQAVTGAGFRPKAVVFLGSLLTGTAQASIGLDDGTTPVCLFNNSNSSADTWGLTTTQAISFIQSGTATYEGKVSSFDTDGFTVSWTKTGSPTGINTIAAVCVK